MTIGIAGLVLLSLFAGPASATGHGPAPADHDQDEPSIGSNLQDVEGEVQVIVQLADADRSAVKNAEDPAEVLENHADRTQEPVRSFAAQRNGVTIENSFWITNAVHATVDTERVPLEKLREIEGVTRLHANVEVEQLETTAVASNPDPFEVTDEDADYTYGLEQIGAPEVWDAYGARGGGVTVAVLDTGVAVDHEDVELADDGWAEFDEDGQPVDSEPQDYAADSHGTHVSSTVVGGNASGRWIGVAPEADLVHGAVLTDCGSGGCSGTFAQVIAGMEWAVDNDADVVSMSFGQEGHHDVMIDPIRNARAAGAVPVVAIGNGGAGTSSTPGNVYDAFGVGASNESRQIAAFSSGERIDTDDAWGGDAPDDWPDEYVKPNGAAPGVGIVGADRDGGYTTLSGTSMATPHVAGAVALALSATDDDPHPDEIVAVLEDTARFADDPPDERYGHGVVDALGATEELVIRDYANENGKVDTDGLRDAVTDWRAGEIDTDLLREVVDAWRSGEPVT